MPFYEYEYTLHYFNEILKERKEGEDKKSKEYEDKYNIKGMSSQASKNMGSQKMPSFKMPNMSMPKL